MRREPARIIQPDPDCTDCNGKGLFIVVEEDQTEVKILCACVSLLAVPLQLIKSEKKGAASRKADRS